MNMDEILNNKQVVNEEQFENGKDIQEASVPIIMNIMRGLGDGSPEELVLEFYFYTDENEKAENMAEALSKFGYDVQIDDTGRPGLCFLISGQTIPMPNEDEVIESWAKKMNEIGYIHDCQFGGWGIAVMKGAWFSDDAPEEEIRKRLGFPPMEE